MAAPECPVCLQSYDGACAVPRVLTCGHTACEVCLTNIPKKFPDTIRCPACTVLVKLPTQGPSALPRNIDLLRLCPSNPQNSSKPRKNCEKAADFVPRSWSDEFYFVWKDRVLPYDVVSVEKGQNEAGDSASSSLLCGFWRDEHKVSLLRVGSFRHDDGGSVFKYSYVGRMMNCLCGMSQEERDALDVVLSVRQRGICKVFGLWGDFEEGLLYLIGERLTGLCFDDFDNLIEDDISCFAVIGMQICEAFFSLHKEGVITGCLGFSCVKFDDFGNAYVDLIELLDMGRNVYGFTLEETRSCGKRIGVVELGKILHGLLKKGIFMSPELLSELLKRRQIMIEGASSNYFVSYGSDVWPLCCLLLKLLLGEHFLDDLIESINYADTEGNEEGVQDLSVLYTGLQEKISSLLESKFGGKFESACKILCQCFSLDPQARPLVTDLWRCIRELIINRRFTSTVRLDNMLFNKRKGHCLVLGELCCLLRERSKKLDGDDLNGVEDSGEAEESGVDKDFVDGLSEGKVTSKDIRGHLDCVTGLAIGGGLLFSSSFDKSIHLWSLQDFSHMHAFKGHENKVMALVYIDGPEEPLCVSGDAGGGIFVWSTSLPLSKEPLRKWYEPIDWRYSGIHALAFSEGGYLYSGSGDRTVKAWSLQDGNLICAMTGHKSVVSTLVIQNGVLYSGSWDGTIRLWSLSDHSLLTMLGEETLGPLTSVLSLAADQQTLVAAHENGSVKVWRNDTFLKSIKIQSGAIFGIAIGGKWIFSGGWDKTINVQELTGDEMGSECKHLGSIPGSSVITSLLHWQGKLFAGYADRLIRVYYYDS